MPSITLSREVLKNELGLPSDAIKDDIIETDRYTNHSGGAYGVDTMGCIVGISLGFKNHNHYRPKGNPKMSRRLRQLMISPIILSDEQLDFGRKEVNRLLGKNYQSGIVGDLQSRNYFQVVNSQAVYCFSKKTGDSTISGGTNTALQLAIKMGRDAYVFDLNSLRWFVYNPEVGSLCEMSETPELTFDYAIVGTRDVEDYETRDPKSGIWSPRLQYLGKDVESAVGKALEKLFLKTRESYRENER